MDVNKTLFLIASLFSSLLLHATHAVPATRGFHKHPVLHHHQHHDQKNNLQPALQNLCKSTTNPILCANTILPHMQGAVEPAKALAIEVDATLQQTQKTLGIIDGYLQGVTKESRGAAPLLTCKQQYQSIVDSINETKAALAKHDLVEAKFKFSAVMSFQASCKDEYEGSIMPFADDSDAIYQLGGNSLDIIADMERAAPKPQLPPPCPPSPYSNVIGTVS